MEDTVLNQFNEEYKNVNTPLKRNYELTKYQENAVKDTLEMIYKNIMETNVIYTSDFKSIQMLLKDLQFFEYINREELK